MRADLDKQVKRSLKADPAVPEIPMDDAFYERLHDRIMAAVEHTEIEPRSLAHILWDKPRRMIRGHWKAWVVSGTSMLMVLVASVHTPAVLSKFLDESHTVQVVRNEDQFIDETINSPEAFSDTLVSYQSEDDFFVDVAERSFHDLSQEHVREIMGEAGP
jgi:hypothetical protein